MKTKEQKYTEAVERNIRNAKMRLQNILSDNDLQKTLQQNYAQSFLSTLPVVKMRIGIRLIDHSYDSDLLMLRQLASRRVAK